MSIESKLFGLGLILFILLYAWLIANLIIETQKAREGETKTNSLEGEN